MNVSELGTAVPVTLPEPTDKPRVRHEAAPVTARAFRTGFCGPSGTCHDSGHRCPGLIQNGSNAPEPIKVCSCTCHM